MKTPEAKTNPPRKTAGNVAPRSPRVREAVIANDDIAASARESNATASRYCNSPGNLKAEKAQRVCDAVTASGYVPNFAPMGSGAPASSMVRTKRYRRARARKIRETLVDIGFPMPMRDKGWPFVGYGTNSIQHSLP